MKILITVCLILTAVSSLLVAYVVNKNLSRETRVPLIVRGIMILTAVFGALLIAYSSWRLIESDQKSHWPTVDALILKAEAIGPRNTDPWVTYSYTYKGLEKATTRPIKTPGFGQTSSRTEVAIKTLALYPEGETMTVYVNPNDPTESIVDPKPKWDTYTHVVFGGLLFSLGFGSYLTSRHRPK